MKIKNNLQRVLHISPNFNYSCGVSKYIYLLFKNSAVSNLLEFHFITNGGDSLKRLEEINIKYKIVKFSTGFKNIFFIILSFLKVRKYCISNKIDIIHTHHRFPELLAFFISKTLNVKTVTTAHSYVTNYKFISYKSDKIIAVSNFIKNNIINSFNVDKNKIIVLHNFIEQIKSIDSNIAKNLKEEYKIIDEDQIILFIGRISKIKGIDILLSVYELLKKDYKNLKLLLVGEIQDDFKIELNLIDSKDIILIPPQNYIENFYKLADILVLPSRMDPFPYTMLEAALAELPIIASNVGGIPEFITHNYNGLLFDIKNPEELILGIKEILNSDEVKEKLIQNNKKEIQKYLNKENHINILINLYREVI